MACMYPMMLDVSDRLIVIIGGGSVAARKAIGLLDSGAERLRVVAPDLSVDLPHGLELLRESYRPDHLDGATLVFAATNLPAVNAAVVRDAHARNLLVCRADPDEDQPGDFATPARLRRGPVIVTVSTRSPSLAVLIRDRLGDLWDQRWSKMAEAIQTLRPQVLSSKSNPRQRTQIFRELATEDALKILDQQGIDGLKRWLIERHPQLSYTT